MKTRHGHAYRIGKYKYLVHFCYQWVWQNDPDTNTIHLGPLVISRWKMS